MPDNVVAIPIEPDAVEKPSADYESNKRGRTQRTGMIDATEQSPATKFSSYEAKDRPPYTVEYLDMGEYYDFDVEGDLKPKVAEIEAYLMGKMAGDNILFAKAWLDKLASELNFQDNEKPMSKFERLYELIKYRKKIEEEAYKKELIKQVIASENEQETVKKT